MAFHKTFDEREQSCDRTTGAEKSAAIHHGGSVKAVFT